jgi:UTP:GlnB (protein PII) uridylyltransferase
LLFQLSNIINTLNLSIEHAKINTLGNRVEDSFILQAKHGVLTSETIKKLSENIQEKLGITIAV